LNPGIQLIKLSFPYQLSSRHSKNKHSTKVMCQSSGFRWFGCFSINGGLNRSWVLAVDCIEQLSAINPKF